MEYANEIIKQWDYETVKGFYIEHGDWSQSAR